MDSEQKAKDLIKMAYADCEAAMASSVPYSICFHAQQATEKYLKAFLEYHGQAAPKSHDLSKLITRCSEVDNSLDNLLPLAGSLQEFAVDIRYSSSKELADKKCPEAWNAMLTITNALKERLPDTITKWQA